MPGPWDKYQKSSQSAQSDGPWNQYTEAQGPWTKFKAAAPPKELPNTPEYGVQPETFSDKVGKLIPQGAMPALTKAKQYLVDPFEKMAAYGAEKGADLAEAGVRYGVPGFMNPITGASNDSSAAQSVVGAARGAGSVIGSTITDARNWPLLGSAAARPILQKLISRGFAAQMGFGAYQGAKNLHDNWDNLTPKERGEIGAQAGISGLLSAAGATHGVEEGRMPSEVVDKGAQLKQTFGEKAQGPVTPAPKPPMTIDEVRSKLAAIDATKAEPPKPIEAKPEIIRPKVKQMEVAGKPAPKVIEATPVETPKVDAEIAQIKAIAAPARDTNTLAAVKAEHPEWTLSQQLMEAAKRVQPPKAEALKPTEVLSPARGTELKEPISPDALDSGARSLFGQDNYTDLSKPEQDSVVKSLSKTTVGRSIRTPEGRAELGLKPPSVQDKIESIKQTIGVPDRPADLSERIFRQSSLYRAQGLSEAEQAFHLMKDFPDHADKIAEAYGAKQASSSSGLGGEIKAAPTSESDRQPLPSSQAAKGPGESVPPAKGPALETEPRSLRGEKEPSAKPTPPSPQAQDLGARPPIAKPPILDAQARLKLHRERVEAMQQDPKYKGVAKARLQEIASEQMNKERGSLGGSPPEERGARREEKVAGWINQLRDDKSNPEVLDTAFKMLRAYGMEDNEIIRRVSGGAPSITPRERFEQQQARTDALNQKELGYLKGRADQHEEQLAGLQTQPLSGFDKKSLDDWELEQKAMLTGGSKSPDIDGVKPPAVEELNRMMALPSPKDARQLEIERREQEIENETPEQYQLRNDLFSEGRRIGASDIRGVDTRRVNPWKDERGFWTLLPRKAKPIRPGSSTLDELTAKLEASLKASAPDDSRMRFAEKLGKEATEGWTKAETLLGRIHAQALAMKDSYFRPPVQTDYTKAMGRFSGSLNRAAWELNQFAKAIKKDIPDARRREGITNWIQADGDPMVLADRAKRSKGSLRAGYEAALSLTPEEQKFAQFIKTHFDQRLQDAIRLGILKDGLENYVPQVWKPKDQGALNRFFSSITRSGTLVPDFKAARKRIFESYFEGEQAGRVPQNKDIGFLVGTWNKAFNQALASRALIRELTDGQAKDGRPIVSSTGVGKAVYDSSSPLDTDEAKAYYIHPKIGPEETEDYKALNHPALSKWTWVTKDANGAPVFMKGDLRVHPDHAKLLDNVINRGRWAAEHPVQSAVLKGQGFFKATLLSASPFHQIQEGVHAILHGISPFSPPEIDLNHPSMQKLLDNGFVIGNADPVSDFEEGLTSAGALGKIPGVGGMLQKYSQYLFKDYIPRLKAKMGMEAYERNLKRFDSQIKSGKMTTDQIAEITASQANAAFGELNYITLGRDPQMQAVMRMMFLAPDFLEARTRFVGQALKPTGREQFNALFLRGALGMYATARILNKLLDDDYHWDKPFSLIIHGYEYKTRSLPGDVWHLMSDYNSFLQHRLNPVLVRPLMEGITGKDDFGRKRNLGEQALDFVRAISPIPTQGFFKSGGEDPLSGITSSFGVTRSKYRSKAAAMAHGFAVGTPTDITSHHINEMVRDIQAGQLDGTKIGTLLINGKMNPRDVQTALKEAQLPELYRDFHRLPVEQKAKVLEACTPTEAAELLSHSKNEMDVTRLLPEQRAEYMKNFASQ